MILCCGEALIDMLPRQTAEGGSAFLPVPGGAVFNTAIALGRLGTPTAFFTGISSDLFGRKLIDALEQSDVDHSLAAVSDRPTTLAFVTLQDGQARYRFYDENTAGRMLSRRDMPDLTGLDADALFFGGISLVSEPAASSYEAFMLKAAEQHSVMLDPNIRPGFITDEPAYRARLDRMIRASTILKASDDDLRWLLEADDPDEAVSAILAKGPALVIVTRGAEGVIAATSQCRVSLPAREARVVDTVGAGDTFNAGVLSALHETRTLDRRAIAALDGDALAPCIRKGIDAAAITVSRAGANPPWRHEMPAAGG